MAASVLPFLCTAAAVRIVDRRVPYFHQGGNTIGSRDPRRRPQEKPAPAAARTTVRSLHAVVLSQFSRALIC
ncbi:hypothetical protein EJB05_28601, partial [Eragrostis curvula]